MSPCAENYMIENNEASGIGLVIGSIGSKTAHTCVNNVTFRNNHMQNTWKGIYVKSSPGQDLKGGTGMISNILFENITIENPTQWPIWIGPQQASYEDSCSIRWPYASDHLIVCENRKYSAQKNLTKKNKMV